MPRRRASAFTLLELLVVVAIISILASLIAAALPAAKERAQRAACVTSIRQFSLACHLYGIDSIERLPIGASDLGLIEQRTIEKDGLNPASQPNIDEHIPILSGMMWTNLLQYAGSEKPMNCPSLRDSFAARDGLRLPGYGIIIGYDYLGGHLNTPWPTTAFTAASWISPRKLTADPSLLLAADLNVLSAYERTCFIPHTKKGPQIVGEWAGLKQTIKAPANIYGPDDLHPAKFGALGGNLAWLDGSVRWRGVKQMKGHMGSSRFGDEGALAIW